jgi:hypothetical protein
MLVRDTLGQPQLCPCEAFVRCDICVLILLYASSRHAWAAAALSLRGLCQVLYVCPHTAVCVSSYCYICVLIPHTSICTGNMEARILLYLCPQTTIYVSAYCYMCILILICVQEIWRPPLRALVYSGTLRFARICHRYHYMCVHILLYICPNTAIYVSAYCCICVLMLLHMCPHTAIYMCTQPSSRSTLPTIWAESTCR